MIINSFLGGTVARGEHLRAVTVHTLSISTIALALSKYKKIEKWWTHMSASLGSYRPLSRSLIGMDKILSAVYTDYTFFIF